MKEVDDSPLATQRVAEVLDLRIKGSEMKHCIAYSRIKMDGAKATGVLFSMKEPGACQDGTRHNLGVARWMQHK